MSHYNIKLIALSLLLSYLAVLLTFNLCNRLYKSLETEKPILLAYSSLIIGTCLWSIHFLDVLALPALQSAGYHLGYVFVSWLCAISFCTIVLQLSSRKSLPLKPLVSYSFGGSILACSIFYFSIASMQIKPEVTFIPSVSLLSLVITFAITMLCCLIIYWVKGYAGKSPIITKSIFSAIISIAIYGVHLIYFASIKIPEQAISSVDFHPENTLLGVTIALGLISLFLVSFVVAVFYDKFGYNTFKFNFSNKFSLEEINKQALVDTLTQLPNRRAFMQHLELAIKRCERNGTGLALAFIDVDDFKQINDAMGHKIGDQVLQKIASRLVTAVRGCDEVARIGGDEFVAIIEGVEDNEDYIAVVERMINAVHAPCTLENVKLNLSVSIGVAMHAAGGSIDQLINAADTAMYRAKKDGKDQFRFFDAEIAQAIDQLLEIQYDLKNALANDELKLYYQIKVNSITREPEGAEALLRWEHPVRGLLYPADFMHAADRFGLSHAICDWVIEESCKTLELLKRMDIPYKISVNISHQQMLNENLVSNITDCLHRYNLDTSSLIVEMTEYTALKNQTKFVNQLNRFKLAGIKVTLDDFGTYSSSLTNLQKWQVDELKLDPSFTEDIETNKRTHGVIQAVIELAHVLDLNVIAEGVENENQRRILADLGCDEMQGYFISRPLPDERFINLVKNLNSNIPNEGRFFFKELSV